MKSTRAKTPKKLKKNQSQDPVEVYCRVRPLENISDVCISKISSSVVQLTPPENSVAFKNGNAKELQYTFQYVFDDNTSQKQIFDHVAFPLVEDLLLGKNGLLFTYGITSSGKTFTMAGTPQDGGILPRCLDVIFNSINPYQAKKYVFKPDKMNGFDVQSIVDAMLERQQRELLPKTPTLQKKIINKEGELCDLPRVYDPTKIEDLDEDNSYAVFVSYIEIYNNYVYDLLEDMSMDPNKTRMPQSKNLREDGTHNVYVIGVSEIEVKSTEEAFDVFCKGQRRRRVAHTQLNTESSRSHSVFNIRLVQAPLDGQGEEVVQNKTFVHISQLSLVDLAGSERTSRTRNAGDRLREAGSINNSLMVLRTCIEILRENQLYMANKIVPYRDTKLTHLFKHYFDGEGKVKMIVCVSPAAGDYDETLHVMRFAELTQEVQIGRPLAVQFDLGLTPGRRQAAQVMKETIKKFVDTESGFDEFAAFISGGSFPSLEMTSLTDDKLIPNLIEYLEEYNRLRDLALLEYAANQSAFRDQLLDFVNGNSHLKQQVIDLKVLINDHGKIVQKAELRNKMLERENEMLKQQITMTDLEKRELQTQGKRLWQSQAEMQTKMLIRDEKLRQLKEIVDNPRENVLPRENIFPRENILPKETGPPRELLSSRDNIPSRGPPPITPRIKGAKSEPKLNYVGRTANRFGPTTRASQLSADTKITVTPKSLKKSQSPPHKSSGPMFTPRHRRSKSANDDVWLEHKPAGHLELDTVLQPSVKNKRSVTKVNVKDTQASSKYILRHQEIDSSGDLETQFIKGDILPTAGGGSSVIFNDVETLKQISPNSRKRGSGQNKSDFEHVPERCSVGIENHSSAATMDPSLQHAFIKKRRS